MPVPMMLRAQQPRYPRSLSDLMAGYGYDPYAAGPPPGGSMMTDNLLFADMLDRQPMQQQATQARQQTPDLGPLPSTGGQQQSQNSLLNDLAQGKRASDLGRDLGRLFSSGSYMGGSGPAAGSFRGAQEVGLGSTSAAAPQSAGMSNMFGMTSGEGMGAMGPGLLWAYLIGKGKMMENDRLSKDPDDPMGNFGLSMLGPSAAQIFEDPMGMGLPTLFGLPFLTPFTASDESKGTAPEWGGLWSGFGL